MSEQDPYEDVPEGMREWLRSMPQHRSPNEGEGEAEIWERFESGRCMTCGSKLRDYTTVVVNAGGIAACFCSGVCATDMANIGWLQEAHDDIIDKIKFRGGEDHSHDE